MLWVWIICITFLNRTADKLANIRRKVQKEGTLSLVRQSAKLNMQPYPCSKQVLRADFNPFLHESLIWITPSALESSFSVFRLCVWTQTSLCVFIPLYHNRTFETLLFFPYIQCYDRSLCNFSLIIHNTFRVSIASLGSSASKSGSNEAHLSNKVKLGQTQSRQWWLPLKTVVLLKLHLAIAAYESDLDESILMRVIQWFFESD